jgi:DNA-directed RNA polymerase specialized sigma24 family protein
VENGIHVERVRYVVDALSEDNPRQGDVCRLKFWFGFKVREIADMLKVSEGTVEGDWRFAKAYLKRELGDRNN